MVENFRTVRGYQLLEQHKNSLTHSLEDYLEMIYRNMIQNGYVRIGILATELNVAPSSASKMTHKLAHLGFLQYEKYGVIRLTDKGLEVGEYLLWRHEVINDFFHMISNEPERAFVEAELAEHVLGRSTVRYFERLMSFFKQNPDIYSKFNKYVL